MVSAQFWQSCTCCVPLLSQQWKTINMPQLELGKHNFENLNTIVETMPGLTEVERALYKAKVSTLA